MLSNFTDKIYIPISHNKYIFILLNNFKFFMFYHLFENGK